MGKGVSLLSKLSSLSKWKSLLLIAGSVALISGTAIWSLFQKEEEAEEYIQPETSQTIFQEETEVDMAWERGEMTIEKLNTQVNLGEDNTLHLGVYTQNYNNLKWGKREIAFKQFTTINDAWSRVYIVHPKEVEVSDNGQIAYTVPKHEWIKLIPSEEDPLTKVVSEQGKTLVCEATGLVIPIPFAGDFLESFIDDAREAKEKVKNTDLEKIIQNGYVLTKIPAQTTRNLSSNITAREYAISFDTSSFKEGETIPAYLWIRTVLGDSSESASGSAPNKCGLEEKVIEFKLKAKKAEVRETVIAKEESKKEDKNSEEAVLNGKAYGPLVGIWTLASDSQKDRFIDWKPEEFLFFSPEGWGVTCPTHGGEMFRDRNTNEEYFFNYQIGKDKKIKKERYGNNELEGLNWKIASLDDFNLQMIYSDENGNFGGYKKYLKVVNEGQEYLIGRWGVEMKSSKVQEELKEKGLEFIFMKDNIGKILKDKKEVAHCFYILKHLNSPPRVLTYLLQGKLGSKDTQLDIFVCKYADESHKKVSVIQVTPYREFNLIKTE